MSLPPVIVTNFKRRITGVFTTALNVTAKQRTLAGHEIGLCGPTHELKLWHLILRGFTRPPGYPFRIWHVRRNSEMIWGLIARDILRQPVRLVFTSAAIRRHSALPRWLIRGMDGVVATSEAAAKCVPQVALIQNHGVDTDKFKPGEKTQHPTLIYMGRIRPQKGVHIMLAALCQVLPDFPDAQVHMVGVALGKDQDYLSKLQQESEAANISHQITWHGRVSDDQLSHLLSCSHICVATPLREEFGLTPFEGLSAGCALVVSDTGAFRLAIAGGQTGRMVPPDDIRATARALRDLLSDPAMRANMMQRAREVACTHFPLEGEAKALLTLYQQMWEGAYPA